MKRPPAAACPERTFVALVCLLTASGSCTEPPKSAAPAASGGSAGAAPATATETPPSPPSPPPPSPAPSRPPPASRRAPDAGAELVRVPPLLAADGTALPQTEERPRLDSPGFQRRLEQLVAAIAQDDPERALPAFFPLVAYEQVKAIAAPGRDWRDRLVRAFQRDIHDYHRQLGADAAGARLARLSVDERKVRWMDPGAEGNRLGYYRVTRSKLQLRLSNGAERELELTSLISWRGEWYVVHLHGFG
jgi:hypothetical protein